MDDNGGQWLCILDEAVLVRDLVVAVQPQCMLEIGGSCHGKESCIRRSRFRRCIKSKCQMMTFFEITEGELEIEKGLL